MILIRNEYFREPPGRQKEREYEKESDIFTDGNDNDGSAVHRLRRFVRCTGRR